MRILLDTNIFIPLEDSSINFDERLGELNRIVSGSHQLLIHPATIFDLKRDKNKERREKIILRLQKYIELESPPSFEDDEEEDRLMGKPKKDNDHIDNLILLALQRNCVHWLITEDTGIHSKAKLIGEQERVLRVDQAINALRQDHSNSNIYPNIEDVFCHSIDIKNSFFDSLRQAYDFDNWFKEKCAREGRKTWISRERNDIHAICIYKEEIDPIVTIDRKALKGKAIKLCTFKVVKYGYKIGELLLKQAFTYAISKKADYIYSTVEPNKHKQLEELFSDFGFYQYGIDTDGRDSVFIKEFPRDFPRTDHSPLEYAIKYFPLIKISTNSVYIIPIQPEYHKILFPELNNQTDLFTGINSAGNTIKKAYLCHASTKSIKQGDILFFYRSQDEMAITSYGIVDQFHIENDPDNILKWVGKRTVYPDKDIKKMACKEVKVILFRLVGHFDKYLDFDRLKVKKIVNGSIQSITKIPSEKVKEFIYEAKLNNRVLSD